MKRRHPVNRFELSGGVHPLWPRLACSAGVLMAWPILFLALTSMTCSAASPLRGPEPATRIPLDPIGYQPLHSASLLGGSSMMTVHFVDDKHLLITFTLRRLLVREPDTPDDQDRTIGAFLVELPTGKVIAKTEWRVHDMGQYLWSLGRGRFLLRIRDQLTMIDPARETVDAAFRQQPFLNLKRRVVAPLGGARHELLTIETADPQGRSDSQTPEPPSSQAPVQINFYRIFESEDKETDQAVRRKLTVAYAGMVHARSAIALPISSAGYLNVVEDGRDRYGFNFNAYGGKTSELAGLETSCFPRPVWVSQSEFISFGCHGSPDKQVLAGFNLKGEAMWQQGLPDSYVGTNFAFAPVGGRFALERTLVTGSFDNSMTLSPEQVTSEDVRVYQTYSGRQVFHIDCSPVQLAGENFDLSPDGAQLAVFRDTLQKVAATKDTDAYANHSVAVEVYDLPKLTKDDTVAVNSALAITPPRSDTAIRFTEDNPTPASTAFVPSAEASSPSPGGPSPTASPATVVDLGNPGISAPADSVSASGDPEPTTPRKPPTLYAPGEAPSKPQ
jgi:hypothetical protein